MKRKVLIARLRELAAAERVEFSFRRHGGRHDLYRFGQQPVVIPRHREVDERTARAIIRDCEREGGERQ
ncbi:hypothetical protein [Curtobacterium sp. RRHDQ66]|uniref:hypothetical protein n=1 Tax=Curtobacterium guangdongense TaxID=3413380 RepID=UPI003BF55D78